MENKSDIVKRENQQTPLLKEQKEKGNKSYFSNLNTINIKSFLTPKNITNIITTIVIIYLFYYIFIKEDDYENINTLEKMKNEEKKFLFIDTNPSELNINNVENNPNENLIIGINFGNLYSSYSYSFDKNISKIISEKKESTELELSKENKKGLKFSQKASVSLMNYKLDELKKIIFLKGFKTLLYEDENYNEFFYQYNNDNNMNRTNIFIQYFNLLKSQILSEINKQNKNSFIKWVLAIPENIKQFEKQLIKNITTELEMYNINIIYESEAASMAMFYDKMIPISVKQKNKVFMLIDAGGYSIDITVYKFIDENGTIEQIKKTKSLNLGLFDINNKIVNSFKEILGKNIIDNIKKNKPGEYIKLINEINKIIENTYNINGIEIYEMNNLYGEKEGNFTYKNNLIEVNKIKIKFPLSLSGNIISENMDLINEKINSIINDIKSEKKLNINNIIVTGGLSKNKIFRDKLLSNFNETEDFIHYLSSYENVISKGAVIYGINPDKIKYRISPITLGIRKNDLNNKKENIDLVVKKGEEIKNNLVKYIIPSSSEQNYIKINVYTSNDYFKDLNELENHLEGKIVLKLDKRQNGKIKLIVKYDTVISFYANYENGNEVESFFEYYKL